jgi:hypothetical protein
VLIPTGEEFVCLYRERILKSVPESEITRMMMVAFDDMPTCVGNSVSLDVAVLAPA